MADILITLTCGDYARVMPLATADVKPDGIALTLIHGTGGSWEMRAEMLRRALSDPAVQGGEASMAGHLRRIDNGDRSFVGLPVFPLRNFTARDLYVRKGGGTAERGHRMAAAGVAEQRVAHGPREDPGGHRPARRASPASGTWCHGHDDRKPAPPQTRRARPTRRAHVAHA